MTTLPTIAYLEAPEVIDHMGFWQAAPSDHLTRYIRHDAPGMLAVWDAIARGDIKAAQAAAEWLMVIRGEL